MDIVTHCRVPRYLHNDLPLGNPLGAPWDYRAQRQSIETALAMASGATRPVVQISTLTWPGDPGWKSVYNRVDDSNRTALLKMGEVSRARRAADKAAGRRR